MLEAYTKDGTLKNIVEENDINSLKYIASTGYNKTGTKFQIELDMPYSADKTAIIVFGTHNTVPFLSLIYIRHNDPNATINNLVNSVNVASVSSYEDKMVIRINTETYGSCGILSPVPILNAFCTN